MNVSNLVNRMLFEKNDYIKIYAIQSVFHYQLVPSDILNDRAS